MNKLLLIVLIGIFFTSCSPNNVTIDKSLGKYFDSANTEGSFALLNNQTGFITIYNMKADTQRVSPGNIFKIAGTMIALNATRITDSSSRLRVSDQSNDSISLKTAFDNNDTAFFSMLYEMVGNSAMSIALDSLQYGNMQSSGSAPFWLDGMLKISPDEMLGFMSKIYFDKLSVGKYPQQVMKDLLLKEDNTLYKFCYTTGLATVNQNREIAWVCGWVVENLHVYFFVSTTSSKGQNTGLEQTSLSVTKNILNSLGFFKGKK